MKNYLKITLPEGVQQFVYDNTTEWYGSRLLPIAVVESDFCLSFLAEVGILFRPDDKDFYVFNYHWLTDYVDGAIVIELEE